MKNKLIKTSVLSAVLIISSVSVGWGDWVSSFWFPEHNMSNGSSYASIENRTGQTLLVALDTRYSGFFYGYNEGATLIQEIPPSEYIEEEGKYKATVLSLGGLSGQLRYYMGYAGSKILINYKDDKNRSNTLSFKMPKASESIDEFHEEGFRISPMWGEVVSGGSITDPSIGWKFVIEKDDTSDDRKPKTYDEILKQHVGTERAKRQQDTKPFYQYKGKFYTSDEWNSEQKKRFSGHQEL